MRSLEHRPLSLSLRPMRTPNSSKPEGHSKHSRGLSNARRAAASGPRLGTTRDELLALRNIGPAMRRDFALLGIGTVKQLARCRADRLYEQLQALTGQHQDPCVLDTFAAAIHQAHTGEALPWWHFSRERKRRTA